MLLDANGQPLRAETKGATILSFSAFDRWAESTLPTPKAAWDVQQKKIDLWASSFDQAKNHIESLNKALMELKDFSEQNMVIMSKLEQENMILKGNL